MRFELSGETPSKKNSRINTRSGRSFPNKRYTLWHNNAVQELISLKKNNIIVPIAEGKRISITLSFFHGDLKRRDSDNQCSSILDTLIDAGVIPDDNWKVVPRKIIIDEYDKGNPHCIIEIEEPMTRKQIAEVLGIHIQIVHDAFEQCGKSHPEIKEKSASYNGHKAVDFSIEEILLAMSYARCGKGISNLQECILKDEFQRYRPKETTKDFGIKGTQDFLEKVKNFPKKKCCSTCTYCVKAYMRNRKPIAKPFCNLWNRFLNKINVNPYKDWCVQWEYSDQEPLVFFTSEEPCNLDSNGNIKNEVMGFDISNFHSKSDGEIRLVNEIGIDIGE